MKLAWAIAFVASVVGASASCSDEEPTCTGTTTGGGGGGGEGGAPSCAVGDCASCTASECAESACKDAIAACDSNDECVMFEACTMACAGVPPSEAQACSKACGMKHAAGFIDFNGKIECIVCSEAACGPDCGVAANCSGDFGGGMPSGGGGGMPSGAGGA
ncbi:MAG: hypothetical protein EXR75_06985 [Myxococcales bacterium]|nr:hypothetical protein [Myxococcales bacterium]